MWTQPRATIQQIIEENPERHVLLLAALAGLTRTLDRAIEKNVGDNISFPLLLFLLVFLGPISGIVILYVSSTLIQWTGRWLNGDAPVQHIRAAIAWGNLPGVWGLLLWIPLLAFLGPELFSSEMSSLEDSLFLALMAAIIGFLQIIITIWSFVVLLKSLAQVQGFSAWGALSNLILAGVVLLVPALVLLSLLWVVLGN